MSNLGFLLYKQYFKFEEDPLDLMALLFTTPMKASPNGEDPLEAMSSEKHVKEDLSDHAIELLLAGGSVAPSTAEYRESSKLKKRPAGKHKSGDEVLKRPAAKKRKSEDEKVVKSGDEKVRKSAPCNNCKTNHYTHIYIYICTYI